MAPTRISSVFAIGLLLLTSPASAGVLVNIDALLHSADDPVVVELEAGAYTVTPVGLATRGDFDAWHPWGKNLNCNADQLCDRGWSHSYEYKLADGLPRLVSNHLFFETRAAALENAPVETFELDAITAVEFCIPDAVVDLFDNLGGVSLWIELTSDSVAVDDRSWGAVKALY